MESKSPNLRSSDGTKMPAVTADPLSSLWQAIYTTSREVYSILRDDLNRALDEYRLNNYEKAEAALHNLLTYLDGELAKRAPDTAEAVQLTALRGAAYSLLGRVYDRLGRAQEAAESFRQSIEMYEIVKDKGQAAAVTPQDYRELGIALQNTGRLDEAIYILKQAIERGDQSAEAYRYVGSILHDRGDLLGAQEYLRKATELNPEDAPANVALAENLEAQGQLHEAINSYMKAALIAAQSDQWDDALGLIERCYKLNADNARVLSIKADLLRLMGRYDEALEVLDLSLGIEPEDDLALSMKGMILRLQGRHKEAVEVLEKAIKVNPSLGWLHAEMGEALRQLGQHEEALSAFDRALELAPDNVLAREGRGASLTILNRCDEALEEFDRLLADEPDDAFALAYKGEALRLKQQYVEALEALNRSLEIAPEVAFTFGTKGQVLRAQGDNEKATEALGQAIKLDPSLGWAHAELGEALRLLGRYEEALHALERSLTLEGDNPLILGSKGAVLYAMGKYLEALETLDKSLTVVPDYAWALSLKGSILSDLGEFDEAVRALDLIVEDSPPGILGYSLSLKGWALENLDIEGVECAEEAQKAYEAALDVDRDNLLSRKGVANCLYMLGKTEEAEKEYAEVLDSLKELDAGDAWAIALKGWCLYRVKQHNDAMRRFVDALSLDPTMISAQFDLALVSIDSERFGLALREYERGLELLKSEPAPRHRGLLHVALKDINIALRHNSSLREKEETKEVLKLIREEYEKTRRGAEQPSVTVEAPPTAEPSGQGH